MEFDWTRIIDIVAVSILAPVVLKFLDIKGLRQQSKEDREGTKVEKKTGDETRLSEILLPQLDDARKAYADSLVNQITSLREDAVRVQEKYDHLEEECLSLEREKIELTNQVTQLVADNAAKVTRIESLKSQLQKGS